MTRFPIVLKTDEQIDEPASLYYLVASNGVFQVRNTPTHRSVTRAERDIPDLLTETPRVELNFPMLPAWLLERVIAFFAEVYRQYGGEAIVILFFDPSTESYRAEVPRQRITGYFDSRGRWVADLHLDYGRVERPDGFMRFGTIHSHATLAAYASDVDCEDEKFEDGLHVVFGSFASSELTRSASFVSNGQRFHVDTADVLETWSISQCPVPDGWMEQIECVEVPVWPPKGYASGAGQAGGSWKPLGTPPKIVGTKVMDDDGR